MRWFTDGERRYGKQLCKLASVYLKSGEFHPNYGRRKVWREGLEVAMKIKSSQGQRRVTWVKVEHPFTFQPPFISRCTGTVSGEMNGGQGFYY